MIGMVAAIILFNLAANKVKKKINIKQIAHIWVFTIAFQTIFDVYVDIKYEGYWYFDKNVDWESLPANLFLLPPVNVLFINWFPFNGSLLTKIKYFIYWEVALLSYECLTLLSQPWGYFTYGWWTIYHSAVLNPILLGILIFYYKRFIK